MVVVTMMMLSVMAVIIDMPLRHMVPITMIFILTLPLLLVAAAVPTGLNQPTRRLMLLLMGPVMMVMMVLMMPVRMVMMVLSLLMQSQGILILLPLPLPLLLPRTLR